MSNPYVGEIRMFGGTFAPQGWLFCDGQLLSIAENDVLFNLIGTTYGGDGQVTFALPDLRGRVPVHLGAVSPLIGETFGVEQVTLTVSQLPAHAHSAQAFVTEADRRSPKGAVPALPREPLYGFPPPGNAFMASTTPTISGGSQPHNNLQPYLCVNFIISLFGVFPSQA